jgi:hypothetical protein
MGRRVIIIRGTFFMGRVGGWGSCILFVPSSFTNDFLFSYFPLPHAPSAYTFPSSQETSE